MIKVRNLSFKNLKKLNVQQRIEAAKDPGIGQAMMSALTPLQVSELFPRYYLQRNPDISGFMKALPTGATSQRLAKLQQEIHNTTTGAAAVENEKAGGWRKKVQDGMDYVKAKVLGRGESPQPKLTADQEETAKLLTQGKQFATDDPKVKFMSTLSATQLESLHLQKVKGDDGKEFFKYAPPPISREQAIKSLDTGVTPGSAGLKGSAAVQKDVYDAYRTAGFSHNQSLALTAEVGRENGYRENIIFGTHVDPANAATNLGMISMQGNRHTGLYNFLKGKNLIDDNGQIVHSQDSLIAMAQYQKHEMITGIHGNARQAASVKQFLNDPNIDPENASAILGRDYIRWRYDDPRYAAHHGYRRTYLQQISDITEKMKTGDTGNLKKEYPESLIETAQRRLEVEQSTRFIGDLAKTSQAKMGLYTDGSTPGRATFNGDMPKVIPDGTMGYCGVGTRHAAGQMFGIKYFNNGLGTNSSVGSSAASLSRGNKYFQSSGFYKDSATISASQLADKKYLASLPVGTVISAEGGGGNGHVQIKVGPNNWMSDFDQGDRVLLGRKDGKMYHSFMIHEPNEAGISYLRKRGFDQNVSNDKAASVVTNASMAVQSSPKEDKDIKPVSNARTQAGVENALTTPVGVDPGVKKDIGPGEFTLPKQKEAPKTEPTKEEPKTIKQFVKGEGWATLKDVPNPKYVPPEKKVEVSPTKPKESEVGQTRTQAAVVNSTDNKVGPKPGDQVAIKPGTEKLPETPKAPEPPKVEPKPEDKTVTAKADVKPAEPVKTNSTGGSNKTPTDLIRALPIGGIKDDNSVVVDANERPLFTMNTDKESAVYNPVEKKVDVMPSKKGGDVGAKPNATQSEIESMRNDIMAMKDNTHSKPPEKNIKGPEMRDRDPHMIDKIMDLTRTTFTNPTSARAFSRARFHETGDATNDFHHSGGNSNTI